MGLYTHLEAVFVEHKPSTVVVENVMVTASYVKSKDAAYWLMCSYAFANLFAFEYGAEYVEYTPTQLKKMATGFGKADKSMMVKTANEYLELNLKRSQHNEADAILLGWVYLNGSV